jgi:ATP:cob(I)alamin adenosyltransferase
LNKYLAYSFLYDDAADYRCDFEIASDEISSMIGLLRSLSDDEKLRADLSALNELMYHINPSARKGAAVTPEELAWLERKTEELRRKTETAFRNFPERKVTFVLPQGSTAASYSHIIRNKCKALARLLSRHKQRENAVPDIIFDLINLFSAYFYFLALKLNKDAGIEETPFTSRVYGL